MTGRRIGAVAVAVVVLVAGGIVGAALLLGSDGPGEDCGAAGSGQGDDSCLPPAASPAPSSPSPIPSPDPVAPADAVAAVDAALAGSGLGWTGDEELALVPHCSPVDAVLGYALAAELDPPHGWSPPATDDWALVEAGGSDAGSAPDATVEGTWLVDGEVTVAVSAGTSRVTVELSDDETERLRKHPRVGEPEFMCG